MAELFPELVVQCFTEEELKRGLVAMILAHEAWSDRCTACGEENDDAHDGQAHPFQPLDPVAVFLKAAKDTDDDDKNNHEDRSARRDNAR